MLNFFKRFRKEKQKPKTTEDVAKKYEMNAYIPESDDEEVSWICRPYKKVILTNVNELKDNITLPIIGEKFSGLKNKSWEYLLASQFINAIIRAVKENQTEADISQIFSIEIFGSKNHPCPSEVIRKHLLSKGFKVVKDTPDCLWVEFKI